MRWGWELIFKYREEDLERIVSKEGCELRMNRSIQAEGSFGELKGNSGFRRFLCRGEINVKAETILLALAHNMNSGAMFGNLDRFAAADYWQEHKTVLFQTILMSGKAPEI